MVYPVALRDEIRTWVLIQGKSQRAAASHFGLSRNTVAKLLEEELLRTTRRLMATSPSPDKGMLMGIPVGCGCLNRLLDLLPVLKTSAFKSQRTQDLPPGFNQIEISCIRGLIDELRASDDGS
jgi:hypothetical protein